MKKKRTVFLFGSGATLAWGSPTTAELTTLIRTNGFKTRDNKTTTTEFIYERLLAHGYSSKDVNFETIISVIEELIIYYSQFNVEPLTPSLLSSFFTPRFESELLNYSIKGGTPGYGYELQIPACVDYVHSKPAIHNETPSQFFFQQLILALNSCISARIHEYAYHSPKQSKIKADSDASKSFTNWMKRLSRKSILRLYTLNYEAIFKILLVRAGLSVFDGFHCEEYVGGNQPFRADVCKILSDTESHIHYNLHGSIAWEVLPLDKDQMPNPEIVLSPQFPLPLVNDPAFAEIEKGKPILVANLVAGYQKAQRAMMTPFKQVQFAWDRDCCFAGEIYVIGYSFGDEHINESIKTAIRHNQDLKITIVDPKFIENGMDLQLARRVFPFKQGVNIAPRKVGDGLYSFCEGLFTVHTLEFKEFIESQL